MAQGGAEWLRRAPVWKINSGAGASSPLVIGDRVYLIGWAKDRDTLRCLDLKTGRSHWEHSYPAKKYGRHAVGDQGFFQGTTATPEYDPASKRLFTLSCDGQLCAWDLDGKSLWQLNLYDRFGMERRPQITKRKNTRRDYGYTTSPLAVGDHIIVEVGDPKSGNLMAFRQSDGKLAWTSENRDVAGHSGGPNLLIVDGVPCAVIATSYHLLVTRLDGDRAGESVAEYPWATDFSNTISSAAPHQASQSVLISSRYNQNAMARVAISLDNGATEVWRNRYPSGVCTPVIHKDHIYFANKGLWCIDFASGKLVWDGGRVSDAGSCLVSGDDRIIVWANAGDLSLADTAVHSPKKCNILTEKPGLLKDKAWPHLVLANGHLLLKTVNGDVVCFALSDHG
jgi:outer membrane protein assembly factor BamB